MKYEKSDLSLFLLFIILFANFSSGKDIVSLPNKIFFNKNIDLTKFSSNSLLFNEIKAFIQECSRDCIQCDKGKCILCSKGPYSYKEACYESSSNDNKADNLSFKC